MDDDTDTKLALLASLLEPAAYPPAELIEALAEAKGDIPRAAEGLLLPRLKSSGKRKAGSSLASWLGKKRVSSPGSPVQDAERKPGASPHEGDPDGLDISSGRSGQDKAFAAGVSRPEDDEKPDISTASPSKPRADVMDAFTALRSTIPTVPQKAKTKPQSALVLTSQAAIDAHHLPVTLLPSPLSASSASALYLAMMQESSTWPRHKWYLAGKWVESPHLMTSYARKGDGHAALQGHEGESGKASYFYSGSELPDPAEYPEILKRAAEMVEDVVDAAIKARVRYPHEYAGRWRANVCGANRYDGAKSGVGWHADQLTYLGPYATIASLSLGTPRAFRLRRTDPVDPSFAAVAAPNRTYEIKLGHNSLCLMNAGCQERYKHTVPPQKALDLFRPAFDTSEQPIPPDRQETSTTRINITFRFFRDDFHPSPGVGLVGTGTRQGTPECKCGMPALLRADQKAKARSKMASPPKKRVKVDPRQGGGGVKVVDDDMAFFWQCQSPGQTGDMKGCGFFRILDMGAEGRGPCVGDA